jgi:hypothetical protein
MIYIVFLLFCWYIVHITNQLTAIRAQLERMMAHLDERLDSIEGDL